MGAGGEDLLRFITCGSVDDGKSTLIGRLLHDSKAIFDDQLASLEADSARVGTQGEASISRCWSTASGRARAGHHHRRRLSLFRDRQAAASSSPTRPATSNIRATW